MNNFPSCFRRGLALHQMVQGQGVVNPRIVDRSWGWSRPVWPTRTYWTGAVEGFTALPTGCGKPSLVGAPGLSGLTWRPKSAREVVRHGRSRCDQTGCRPVSPSAVSS